MSLNGMRELEHSIRLGIVGQPIKREFNRSSIGVQSESTRWTANPILYWRSVGNGESNGVQSEFNRSPIGVQSEPNRPGCGSSNTQFDWESLDNRSRGSPIGVQLESNQSPQTMCVSCQETFCPPMGRFMFFLHIPWHKLCA